MLGGLAGKVVDIEAFDTCSIPRRKYVRVKVEVNSTKALKNGV